MSAERDEVRFDIPECSPGDTERLTRLRQEVHPALLNVLVARGASPMEAEDLLADLWGDCVSRSLLDKFNGKCPVQNWLATVATHRFLDLKRRQKHRGELSSAGRDSGEDRQRDAFEQLPAPTRDQSETGLVNLLKESLKAAFAQCPAESLLMLRLVYLNGLSQREVGRMWGWHESKISRSLTQAMSGIETVTLRELQKRDPWLELAWPDFLELCETHEIGFL